MPFVFPELTYRRLIDTPGIGGRLGIDAELARHPARHDGSNMLRGRRRASTGTASGTCRTGVSRHDDRRDARRHLPGLGQSGRARRPRDPGACRPRSRSSSAGRWSARPAAAQHVIEPIVQVVYSQRAPRPARHPERGQPPARVRRDQPLLAQPLSRRSTGCETGLRANLGISYTRYDPAGWSLGVTLGPRRPRHRDRRIRRGHRPRRALVGLCRRGLARASPGGCSFVNRALFDPRPQLPPQRVRAGLRRRLRRRCAPPISISPQDDCNPIIGPQPETNEIALDAARPRATELGAARPLALRRRDEQQPPCRRRHHLRQRVRRVRPFGLASLYLIG